MSYDALIGALSGYIETDDGASFDTLMHSGSDIALTALR